MKKIITFRDYKEGLFYQDTRLIEASKRLKDSLDKLGIEWVGIYSDNQYITVEETLVQAYSATEHSFFIWSNTDVVWNKDPFEGLIEGNNYGFHRTDQPSNTVNYGVDAYRIDNLVFANIMSKDIPFLYNGSTHTDWFCSRVLMHYSNYTNLTGYIDHPEHPRYPGSAGINEYGQTNLKNYNEWADRHGISKT